MATYLIDYENVKSEGIKGVAQLGEEDTVVIFYSHNADTITFEAMDMIFSSKAQVRKYKILCGGKNALDFQLSTYLGYLIHEAKDSYFYIISRDNGFKHVVDFWKRTFRYDGYVYCFPTIADGNARQNRFKNATAKERQIVMEQELVAMSEELRAEEERALEESEGEGELVSAEAAGEDSLLAQELLSEEAVAAHASEPVNVRPDVQWDEPMQIEYPFDEGRIQEEQVTEAEPVQEKEAQSEASETGADGQLSEQTEETASQPQSYAEPEAAPEVQDAAQAVSSAVVLSSVQQHKPVSVMPPAQLPESVRRELEKADAQYASEIKEKDLEKKIEAAAQVSAMTVTVVDSGMTIHHVEEEAAVLQEPVSGEKQESSKEEKTVHRAHRGGRRRKPTQQSEAAAADKTQGAEESAADNAQEAKIMEPGHEIPKQEQTVTDEQTSESVREKPKQEKNAKTARRKKEAAEAAAEDSTKTEQKPEKPARKPVSRSKKSSEGAAASQEESVSETAAVQEKKTPRRGRRPKVQSNMAANFE